MKSQKLSFGHAFLDQQKVLLWGKYVALCGDKPGMPVNFLQPRTIGFELTAEERCDVIEFVWRNVGPVKRGTQIAKEWHIVRDRIESESGTDTGEQR